MKSILKIVAAVSAVSAFCAFAQDDDLDFDVASDDADVQSIESEEAGDDAAEADGEQPDGASAKKDKGDARLLKTLPFCLRLEGSAEVLKPGETAWTAIEEGKFYPLGSAFRTTDDKSRVQIQFGDREDVSVEINAYVSSFGTRFQPLGEKSRTILLKSGVITVKLPRNMPAGVFSVAAPGFEVKNMKGMSRYAYTRTVDGDVAQIRCLTGSLAIEGRNFLFPEVKTACEVKIRSSQDQLFTGLYGNRGDSIVQLDQGVKSVMDYSTGESHVEKTPLEWKLSPKTAVRIHRAVPNIGDRMSVTVMTFDAAGTLKNRCAFTEGRCEVNTGELGPTLIAANNDDAARKAAEASDVEAVDADESDAGSDDDSGSSDDAVTDGAGGDEVDDLEF